jgi:hypothetical protein
MKEGVMTKARMSVSSLGICLLVIGCSPPQGTAPEGEVGYGSQPPRPAAQAESRAEGGKLRFLNRLREADPQYQTIERAVMNEQNELGLILSRNVPLQNIPRMMRPLLKEMAAEFPGEDLTIIAYAPSDPPMKIGTARLDASTREMTYTPVRQ